MLSTDHPHAKLFERIYSPTLTGQGPALLDDDRGDASGAGASGYGVRMLVEVVSRMSAALRRGEREGVALEAFRRRQADA